MESERSGRIGRDEGSLYGGGKAGPALQRKGADY